MPQGPFTVGGRGPTTVRGNRTVFFESTNERGLRPHDYPDARSYERLRLDRLKSFDIPPIVAELLERAPGKNITSGDAAFARGCGHQTEHHYDSGLCAPCILRNSLDSATNVTPRTVWPEMWVMEYAKEHLDATEAEAVIKANCGRSRVIFVPERLR